MRVKFCSLCSNTMTQKCTKTLKTSWCSKIARQMWCILCTPSRQTSQFQFAELPNNQKKILKKKFFFLELEKKSNSTVIHQFFKSRWTQNHVFFLKKKTCSKTCFSKHSNKAFKNAFICHFAYSHLTFLSQKRQILSLRLFSLSLSAHRAKLHWLVLPLSLSQDP